MVQILGCDAHEKSRWRPTVFQFNGLPLDKNIIRCSPFTGKHSSSTCDIFINCWQSDTSLCLHSAKLIYTTRPIVPQVGHLTGLFCWIVKILLMVTKPFTQKASWLPRKAKQSVSATISNDDTGSWEKSNALPSRHNNYSYLLEWSPEISQTVCRDYVLYNMSPIAKKTILFRLFLQIVHAAIFNQSNPFFS